MANSFGDSNPSADATKSLGTSALRWLAGWFAQVRIYGTAPYIKFYETDAGADSKLWNIIANSSVLSVQAANDADSSSSNAIQVQRSGTTVSAIQLYGTRQVINGFLNIGAPSELTITSGAVTATKSAHTIDTEADAASDDLDTINGGSAGDFLVLSAADGARTPTLKDGTGNLSLAGDCALDNAEDIIVLVYRASKWCEVCRSNNGA